ncbi:MAG: preQ(1) synthase [Thermoplasmatales archaeon]|jgi:7-cyano-7-deazaguanine reductase
MSTYEHLQDNIRNLDLGPIDTVDFAYSEKDTIIKIETDEFTSVCPKTGLPDFARIEINYIPDKKLIELKSFKLYLYRYRNVGIFQENAINKILEDIVKYANPKFVVVRGIFNVRGGLKTTITCRYQKI